MSEVGRLGWVGGLMVVGMNGFAEEVHSRWDVEIPVRASIQRSAEPVIRPDPIPFNVLSSRTTPLLVKRAPELPELPPITGTIQVKVDLVEAPVLPEPPPSLPALSPDDPAVVARLAELRQKYRATTYVFLSATVYDHRCSCLRIHPNGGPEEAVIAWSNLDFNHFSGLSTYRVKDAQDGSVREYALLMGIGNVDTGRMKKQDAARAVARDLPEVPSLSDLATAGPVFQVVKGQAGSPAMAVLEQLHDLYRKEGAGLEAAYQARLKAREERKAFLLANPPVPKDVTIRFWNREGVRKNETTQPECNHESR